MELFKKKYFKVEQKQNFYISRHSHQICLHKPLEAFQMAYRPPTNTVVFLIFKNFQTFFYFCEIFSFDFVNGVFFNNLRKFLEFYEVILEKLRDVKFLNLF